MIFKEIAILFYALDKTQMPGRQRTSESVSTPGHGQGEGPARCEFRVSRTKQIVGGAGVKQVADLRSGVSPKSGCLTAWSLLI